MRGERFHCSDVLRSDTNVATLVTGNSTAIAAVKVALAAFAFQELTALGFGDAFGDGFCGFDLHKLG